MWLILAFLSAFLLGFYDVFKKVSLSDNAVIPVLFLDTLFSSFLFLPFIILSQSTTYLDDTIFHVSTAGWEAHKFIVLKSFIVLGSWVCGYFAMKHLPLTIVGPINATRPILVLVGAMLVFGETLNLYQWVGVLLAIKHNLWIVFLVISAILGAVSGLYDKFLMMPRSAGGLGLNQMMVQSWYNVYQCGLMGVMLMLLWLPTRNRTTTFQWRWTILGISIFLCMADFVYFYALSQPAALIAIVSMVRRGSVIVSFLFGIFLFQEKNIKGKAIDLLLVLLGLIFLYIGSRV